MPDTQEWNALPVALGAGGLDLRPNQVSQPPDVLTEAMNVRYKNDRGLHKRNAHAGGPVLSGAEYVNLPLSVERSWLYGWGDYESTFPGNILYLTQQRVLRGASSLGGTPLVWTGDRLFSYAESERWAGSSTYWYRRNIDNPPLQRGVPCYLPAADVTLIDQGAFPANTFDTTVGNRHAVTIVQGDGSLTAQIRDVASGAWVARNLDLLQGVSVDPAFVTIIFNDSRFVVFYSDATSGLIYTTTMTEDHPLIWTAPTARANGQKFDVETVTDTTSLLVWRDTADSKIKATYFRGEVPQQAPFVPATILVASGAADNSVAACAHPMTGEIAVVWTEAGTTRGRCFSSNGVALAAAFNFGAGDAAQYLTVVARTTFDSSGRGQFVTHYNVTTGGVRTNVHGFTRAGTTFESTVKHLSYPAGRSFRIGDEVFCWLLAQPTTGTAQALYYLMAGVSQSRIVGATGRGAARLSDDHLPSFRLKPGSTSTVSGLLPANARSDGAAADIRPLILDMDFLPRLSSGEFGRALYLASALPQVYDGREVVEAGFLQYPEVTGVAGTNVVGGTLAPGDVRQYRVYAVHRNAGGEVTRSPALTFTAPAVPGGNNANTVTFTAIPATTRQDAWFEVYATQNGLSTFYLTSSVLATAAPGNTFTNPTVSFTDVTGDAILAKRPIDPFQPALGQATNLETQSLPGCRFLYSGRDRLWMAGGEIDSGSLAFSKIRQELEQAGWSDEVGLTVVDHLGQAVTSVNEVGDSLIVFLRDRIWAVSGGPDNEGLGGFAIPSLVQAGVGAAIHAGTVQTSKGLAFWSDSGPRLISGGYSVIDLSHRIFPLAPTLTEFVSSAVSVPGQEEVRWYTTSGTALLWDHRANERNQMGRWAVWDNLPVAGAVYYPATGYPVLALTDGRYGVEDPSGVGSDCGFHYTMSWATPELRPGELVQGSNRFRRWALRGEYRGPHTLAVWAYYDGSPMWTYYREWRSSDNLYAEGWGDADNGGTAVWNTDNTAWVQPPDPGYSMFRLLDGTYRIRDRLSRQPGATLKLRFSDLGAPNDTLLAEEVAIELGAKPGLTRIGSALANTTLGVTVPSRSGPGRLGH